MAEQEKDLAFVEFIIKSIVDSPDKVQLERKVDEMGVLITLRVGKEDMGKVIGKDGSTAKSIRTLLRVIGAKNNARVNFKIEEPEGSEEQQVVAAPSKPDVESVVDDLKL